MKPNLNRQAARSHATRDHIVQAALTVFALKGYAATSMDDLCMAAGCSKGGLYHHFPTKSAVLSSVVDRLSQSGALLPPFQASDGSVALPSSAIGLRARLRAGYEACMDRSLSGGANSHPLADILRIGVLIQLLTRGEAIDADEAARRLGIERAA